MRLKKIVPLFLIISLGFIVSFDSPSERYFEIAKNMEILSSVYAEVNRYYVDEVDPNKIMKIGIDAMLGSLDPYTNYIPEDDIEDFRFISTGQYGGIGALVGNRNEKVLILMPYEGFPAYKAGLKIGDEITKIGDEDVVGSKTDDISNLLKGQAGTPVTLKVNRYGIDSTLTFTLIREKITIESVPYYGMVTDDIGYFVLTGFTRDAGDKVENAITELKKQGAKKFIFDLRDNTGGLLDEAVKISNLFIEKGKEVVSMKGKVSKWNETFYAPKDPLVPEAPLVILVNGRSASASEIVSGVVQDYDRGILIGRHTYGKGLVQATMNTAYKSKVKVTTAKYYTPSGRCIQAIDYGNRDEEGKANRIPDSLLVEYRTTNNRLVYDGEGLTPDIEIDISPIANVTRALYNKNLIFEYATKYYYENDTIVSPQQFDLKNEEFEKFRNWLTDKNYSYELPSQRKLEELVASLKSDSIFSATEETIEMLNNKIEMTKNDDLMKHKKEVKNQLESEIVSRYFFQKGIVESSFTHDPDVLKAINVLNDQSVYNKVLARN